MPHPGKHYGQAGQGCEQAGLIADVPAHCRGLDRMSLKVPSNPKYSVIHRMLTRARKWSRDCVLKQQF